MEPGCLSCMLGKHCTLEPEPQPWIHSNNPGEGGEPEFAGKSILKELGKEIDAGRHKLFSSLGTLKV